MRARRAPATMPAYVVALIETITDAERYKTYVGQVEATLGAFGGRFLARRPDPEALEGAFRPSRAVVLEFPDEAAARAWHASAPYVPVRTLRQSASKGTLLLLPGHAPRGGPRVAVGDAHYVEMVTDDVEGARGLCERVHGWRFAEADETLGGARVATLPGGARGAIRAPLGEMEKPVTRVYVRVADLDAATKAAEEAGAFLALSSMDLAQHGRIAIVIVGGVEHGLWQLP